MHQADYLKYSEKDSRKPCTGIELVIYQHIFSRIYFSISMISDEFIYLLTKNKNKNKNRKTTLNLHLIHLGLLSVSTSDSLHQVKYLRKLLICGYHKAFTIYCNWLQCSNIKGYLTLKHPGIASSKIGGALKSRQPHHRQRHSAKDMAKLVEQLSLDATVSYKVEQTETQIHCI